MNVYEFMSNSPWLTFFLAMLLLKAAVAPFKFLFRHLNIRAKGWPPAHVDADGDLRDDGT